MSELPRIHWVRMAGDGGEYCHKCVEIVAEEARKADPKNAQEILVDGGYDLFEVDSPASCERCGQMLACSVLPNGPLIFTEGDWLKAD